jgi:YfiH family protein
MFFRDGGGVYRCGEFLAIPWLEHGFGTRLSGDWLAGRRVASLIQTHSSKVWNFGELWGILGEGDALIGAEPEGLLGIRTADCVPVLAVDVKRRAVAAVHAGWRGIVGGIVEAAVGAMERELGSRREDLRVAVGPAIGECCYEVGPEVAERFAGIFEKWGNLGKRRHVNLEEAVSRQLNGAGVAASNVYRSGLCTRCGAEEFWSFRREGEKAGRMWSAIGVRGDGKRAAGEWPTAQESW